MPEKTFFKKFFISGSIFSILPILISSGETKKVSASSIINETAIYGKRIKKNESNGILDAV